ncbi:MAG: TonB-dependent receptor [Candidatus Eremiobacteraeota bacterium]|nr:TonB-dependent receptor [Candidatus Eremiobacteraeota bacterium]
MRYFVARSGALLAFLVFFNGPLLLPAQVAAQALSIVTGVVTAGDGTPIAGASVTLSNYGRTVAVASSDSHGHFSMQNVPTGTYSLAAAAPGYAPLSNRTVTIAGNSADLALVLSTATTNSLTTIGQVRAQSGQTVSTSSVPATIVNAQSAAASGATTVSSMIWSQLSTTPVIPLGGGSNATVSFAIRGPDPTETLVDVDGHQVNNGNTGDFDLSLLDLASLQEVQLLYGIAPSSLLGPNTIGGAINVLTLQPTSSFHALVRVFGGSFGSYGSTAQATGSDGRWGYALSAHGATSNGSVNETVFAPPVTSYSAGNVAQLVGSSSSDQTLLTKLRYQLGGDMGYGYLQLNVRDQAVFKDDSALLTTYTPYGYSGAGGDDAASGGAAAPTPGTYQSFAGTLLEAHNTGYGVDAQLPLGKEYVQGAPSTMLQFSHLTSLSSQSVTGPGSESLPYLYNQRDVLGDDWVQLDHRFGNGLLSFKYDLGTEDLTTNYVQGQVLAQLAHVGSASPPPAPVVQTLGLYQTQRSVVLRYEGHPTTQIHYAFAGYYSDFSSWGSSFDPRAGFVWTPTGNTALRASVGTTFQTPQLSELVTVPAGQSVPVGGVVYQGNPHLQPDHATDYDIGGEQVFGRVGHEFRLSADAYLTSLRSPSSQLNVIPGNQVGKHCVARGAIVPCPVSYPVNAGDGIYQGVDFSVEQQLGAVALRAGWDVDSSFLTVIPPSIQDGTFVAGQQSLGQPLHKAYFAAERQADRGLVYGAQLNYEGTYNELNRSPYATLDAHLAYRTAGYEFGLYGTNLTNVYANPFTIVGGGILYGTQPGQPLIPTDAYALQGAKIVLVVTRGI